MGQPQSTRVIILMGVSGCGKSVVGAALAKQWAAEFVDADHLHPEANRRKMNAKIPLTDADRQPWLERLRREVIAATPLGRRTVLACSALKRRYRELLQGGDPDVVFVYLKGDFATIWERVTRRQHEFMPAELLESQFAALEEPAAHEALTVSIAAPVSEVVAEILRRLPDLSSARTELP